MATGAQSTLEWQLQGEVGGTWMLSSDQKWERSPHEGDEPKGRQPSDRRQEQAREKFLVSGEAGLFLCDLQVIIKSRHDHGWSVREGAQALHS